MSSPATNPSPISNSVIDKRVPQSRTDLFVTFTLMALQGFGGVMGVVQRELVERKRWLTLEEFVEDWAVAQIMPGPNVVNLSLIIGGRHFGLSGALAAFAGMLTLPLLLILLIAVLYAPHAQEPHVIHTLRAMGAVASGLILATGFRLLTALKKNVIGMVGCVALAAACFTAVAVLRLPLAYPLFGLGLIGCVIAYRKLTS